MRHPARVAFLGSMVLSCMVLLTSACGASVAGTAQVDPAAALLLSVAQSSAAPFSAVPSSAGPSIEDPSVPDSSVAGSVPESAAPAPSSAPRSPPSHSGTPSTSALSRPTTLSCPTGALAPSAKTFCYQIPPGFVDGSSTSAYPGTDPVKTAVQIKGTGRTRDLIFVTSTVLDLDTDNLDGAVIKASLAKAFAANASASGVTAIKQSAVAGDRAFETTIKFSDGVQQRYLIVFAGHERVSVACQSQDHVAAIAVGCSAVLASLQIKNP